MKIRFVCLMTISLALQTFFGIQNGHAETKRYVLVSEGRAHTCALTSTGMIDCWGFDGDNRIGLETSGDYITSPVEKQGISNVINFSTGINTCAITKNGGLYCWGSGDVGRNGNGQTQTTLIPEQISKGVKFKQVASG